MDAFNYLAVLISIILGLSITQLLGGFGRLIQGRREARFYWPAVLWSGILLVVAVQSWWAMFALRFQTEWDFLGFAVVLLHPTLLYLACALILPSGNGAEQSDLRSN